MSVSTARIFAAFTRGPGNRIVTFTRSSVCAIDAALLEPSSRIVRLYGLRSSGNLGCPAVEPGLDRRPPEHHTVARSDIVDAASEDALGHQVPDRLGRVGDALGELGDREVLLSRLNRR